MNVKKITIYRTTVDKKYCAHPRYKDALVNNKSTPTSEVVITNLSLVLLDMFQQMEHEKLEEAVTPSG